LEQIKKQTSGKKPELQQANPVISNGGLLLEKEVLGGLMVFPEFIKEIKDNLEPEDFQNSEIKELVVGIMGKSEDQNLNPHPGPLPSDFAKASSDLRKGEGEMQSALAKEAQFMVESQLEEMNGNSTALVKDLLKAFAMLKIGAIKKRQQHLQNEIKNAENSNNKGRIEELNREFAKISGERIKFEVLL
jgi:hypothetical protein